MGFRTIRARLTLWYGGLFALTFLLLGGAGYGLLAYSLLDDLDSALRSVAQVLAERSQRGRENFPPTEIDEAFRRFFGFSPWERFFGIYDPLGRSDPRQALPRSERLRLSPEALKNASEGRSTFETVEGVAHYPVRILTAPVLIGGRVVNLIQVGMSLENAYRTRRRFLLIALAVLPVAVLLGSGGGWLLARRALGPVDRMVEAARRISTESLGERLADPGAGDEVSRLARTLNQMLDRLENSFRQTRQFSADASHELQTPLTILKGEIEVALRSPRSTEEYRRVLQSALGEIDRIARLVEGLLMLARADAGVLRMDRKRVDLERLVKEVYDQGRRLADAAEVELSLGRVEPVSIQGDYDGLRRVLVNLLENGIKYTPQGGRVILSLVRAAASAVLMVEDTGTGIPVDEQEKIFERFYRSAEARSSGEGGAGLGLCLARSIVEAHGGKMELKSAPGKGSTFSVILALSP